MYSKTIMVGNLARDIELRYLPSGAAIAKSAIATSYKFKASTGEQKDEVCFLDFNVFGKSAEIINQYVRKGSKVLLEGRLALESWTAQDGSKRSKHSLRVETFKFLDSKGDASTQTYPQHESGVASSNPDNNYQIREQGAMNQNVPEMDINEDSIPF